MWMSVKKTEKLDDREEKWRDKNANTHNHSGHTHTHTHTYFSESNFFFVHFMCILNDLIMFNVQCEME